jgi:hypothetical protein
MSKTITLSIQVDYNDNQTSPAEVAETFNRMVRDAISESTEALDDAHIKHVHTVCVDEPEAG